MTAIQVARKKRDSYQHGDLREALIQAGLKLLAESGVEALSLRAAAQLAGVSHAAPYRHFRDKQALVAAIAERGFRMLTASMRAEVEPLGTDDTRARLIALGSGYLKFATTSPAYLHVIFGGVLGHEGVPPSLAEASVEAYETLRMEVARGIERGELRAGDVDIAAFACWSMVHGLAMLITNGAIPVASGKAQRQLIEQLLQLLGGGLFVR
jgi:AcrR family transcriptional regulator